MSILPSINPSEKQSWQDLRDHFFDIRMTTMKELFEENPQRTNQFHIEWEDFLLDYSKNKINTKTLDLLLQLAKETKINQAIDSYFKGEKINQTEGRAVLHTALRSNQKTILVDGINIIPEIENVKTQMAVFCNNIISGEHKGYSGKPITDVVNIGIGGSDLGPDMVLEALQFYKNHLHVHFVSNVDGDHVQEIIKKLNPETTLFVIVSKTFTTQETIYNASTIRNWFLQHTTEASISKHFVAVSTNIEKVTEFGIAKENIFPMWDWVGGRFSLWSAVGLTIALAIGYPNFEKLLLGAQKMDTHFRETPLENNMPVVLALLSIWYNNFHEAQSEAVIPYTQYLNKFATYLQQSVMESNGKSIGRNGYPVNYQTGNIVWGEPGTNAQHAFFQLIHQGTKLIPVDFIGFKESLHGDKKHHDALMANFFAQTQAFMQGKTSQEVRTELENRNLSQEEIEALLPFKVFDGDKPTNTLLIQKLTPESLGKLIALYEHKIFVQGIVWNIFSYDQWGVELGKQLANTILNDIETNSISKHDNSTAFLLRKFLG